MKTKKDTRLYDAYIKYSLDENCILMLNNCSIYWIFYYLVIGG